MNTLVVVPPAESAPTGNSSPGPSVRSGGRLHGVGAPADEAALDDVQVRNRAAARREDRPVLRELGARKPRDQEVERRTHSSR